MKKHKHPHVRERVALKISNTQLAIIALAIAAAGLVSWQISINNSKNKWSRLQSELSGITAQNLTPDESAQGGKEKLPLYITVPILMYHHVGALPEHPDAIRKDLTVSAENFEKQAAWLEQAGYHSITFADILLYTQGKYKLPEKPVIFTFDDGYQDVFDNAVPTLKKHGFAGTFGIITQFPGINTGDNSYASWDTIKAAQKQGMEIVSHTQDHFDGTNPGYSDQFILDNLSNAQKDIQQHLGTKPLPVLIYPYGHYSQRYIAIAEKAGISMGLTEHSGKHVYFDDLMQTPRIRVHGSETMDQFEESVKW